MTIYEHFLLCPYDSCLYYEAACLIWPISGCHLPIALSCLLVQVGELLKVSLANVASHWPFSGFGMGTQMPKQVT